MIKAVFFAALCVAVLAHKDQRQPTPPESQRQPSFANQPHVRVARQMPSMPQMPGGMNPAQFPQMMGDMAQKGIGAMTSMMDPSKWMGTASQMMPKSKK